MPQIYCYVPDEVAHQVQEKAAQAHLSVSKYLALLIKREVSAQWPENFFELFGQWQGEPIERPDQGGYEKRLDID